jgi:hypothetical protein
MTWKTAIGALTLVGFLVPSVADAGPPKCKGPVTQRLLSDLLDAQGTTIIFFPPVPDYVGSTDVDFTTFALVDYAGLADWYITSVTGTSLGTDSTGPVMERACTDGTAEIKVKLSTKNALGFAQSIEKLAENDFDFAATPTIFGNKAVDVAMGEDPALGSATFDVTFRIAAPGAPLPDLRAVVQCPNPDDTFCAGQDYRPVKLDIHSVTFDEQHVLRVHQKGATGKNGDLIFTKEVVEIVPHQ